MSFATISCYGFQSSACSCTAVLGWSPLQPPQKADWELSLLPLFFGAKDCLGDYVAVDLN